MAGTASAQCPEGSIQSGDYCYTVTDGNGTISKYIGAGSGVVIPETIEGLPVVRLGSHAFSNCLSLTSVSIPDSVTSIGMAAFMGCTSLVSINIPVGITTIEDGTFSDCESLAGIVIPDGVVSIGVWAFSNCHALTSATIPGSVITIGEGAFGVCKSLSAINIPDGVVSIGAWTFTSCHALTSAALGNSVASLGEGIFFDCIGLTDISVDAGNAFFSSQDGILYTKDKKTLIAYPGGRSGGFTVPDGVVDIGRRAFAVCNALTGITFPDSLTGIGVQAFSGCEALASVNMGNTIRNVGPLAFAGCNSLTSIHFPVSVTSIGSDAFTDCSSLSIAYFAGNAPAMGEQVFNDCAPNFTICYTPEATGFTTPMWYGYPAADCACSYNSECAYDEICENNECVAGCKLTITHKAIRSEKLFKPKKFTLKIAGWGDFDPYGTIDLGPLTVQKSSINTKKNTLKIKALVPTGLEPGMIPVSVGDCYGEIAINGAEN